MKKLSNDEFIEKAKQRYGDAFDFSKTKYINSQTNVTITCKIHGDFTINPNFFLNGSIYGCPKCSGLRGWDNEKFIEKAKEVHGNKYDYSKVNYVNKRTDVTIICPIHGEFRQNPHNHIFQAPYNPKT